MAGQAEAEDWWLVGSSGLEQTEGPVAGETCKGSPHSLLTSPPSSTMDLEIDTST